MSWISLLWLVSVYLPVFGNRHGTSVLSKQQHIVSTRNDMRQHFPMDLLAESSSSVGNGNLPKMKIDDDRKTLSQQVADGKYGLIQKELFTNPVQRPGVLSYDNNSEVPKDNVNNLGGLNKSDIWLAENHLLVLKGGVFPVLESLPEYSKTAWPPIDDYAAPRRPVKLPKHPKVPPPFPVQLTDGGPIQILGTNFTRTLNDSFVSPPYAVPPLEGYDPGSNPFFQPPYPNPPNATPGEAPFPAAPYYPAVQGNATRDGPQQFPFPINGGLPPFFDSLPPGSAILPPPNITDQDDEDDLSIYYPPPYSFYYQRDNSTEVPPGPLVPGIVLPPPPDFFSILKKPSPATKSSITTASPRPTRPLTTLPPPPTTSVVYKTPKLHTSVYKNVTSKPPSRRIKPDYRKTTVPTALPEFTSKKQQPQKNKSVNVTILRPIKTTKKPPTVYVYDNNISNKPFAEYGPPPSVRHQNKISITTTKIPLRAYFSTSSETDTNLVTSVPEKQQYTTRSALPKHKTRPSTQIYYYDDTPITNSISTPYPQQQRHYVNLTKEYYTGINEDPRKYTSDPVVHVQQKPLQPQIYYLPDKPYITQRPRSRIVPQTLPPSNFKTHIVQLQEQLHAYQRTPKQQPQTVFEFNNHQQQIQPQKPIYQYHEQELPPKPIYQFHKPEIQSPKPVYQYSFEVANYREQHERLQMPPHIQENQNFRNTPKYTVQIEPAVEITTTESPVYKNTPAPIYYPENYPDNSQSIPPQRYYYQEQQKYSSAVTPHPLEDNSFKATPNPVYQPYYTKQDERYFDDITKKYFTTFGKKISTSTTPIPATATSLNTGQRQIVYSPHEENIRIGTNHPGFIPQSNLKGNILINYVNQRPAQNIHAEYVQYKQQQQPQQQPQYPQVTKQVPQYVPQYQTQTYSQTTGNTRQKTPPNNINIQAIRAVNLPQRSTVGEGKPGSFISYELPGDDGAHFYFLTPQLTQKDDRGGITYYYTQPSNPRIRRNSQSRSV